MEPPMLIRDWLFDVDSRAAAAARAAVMVTAVRKEGGSGDEGTR